MITLILGATAVWLFVPLVLGVPLTRALARQDGRHDIVPVTDKDIPEIVVEPMTAYAQALEQLGFVRAGLYQHPGSTKKQKAFIAYYLDEEQTVSASVVCVVDLISLVYLEFGTTFENPLFRLHTYNASTDTGWTMPPSMTLYRHPEITTAAGLLEHHHAYLAHHGERTRSRRHPDSYADSFNEAHRLVLDHQVEHGVMRRVAGDRYGLTWSGAWTMTFRQWRTFRHLAFWRKVQ